MKNSKFISGGLVAMLALSVFVSFSVSSGEELMGDIRNKRPMLREMPKACFDSDSPAPSFFTPVATSPNKALGGQTYGDFGTIGVTVNKDRCAGSTLREYYCDTPFHQDRADIDCEDFGLECVLDANGLGYCG